MALAVVVFASASAQTRSTTQERTIRVGMLAFQGEYAALARWSDTMAYLKMRVPGTRFELLPLTLDGMTAALEAGELDIVFTNPGHYALTVDKYRLAPMLTLRSDRPDKPQTGNRFGAVIFTRSDNTDIKTLADLKGKSFAAVAPEAFGGFLIAADTLVRNGLNPNEDYEHLLFLGFPQNSIVEAVVSGTADAGTVRTGIIERMIERGTLAPDAIRVLAPHRIPGFRLALSTALVPEWTLAATPKLEDDLRRAVVTTLLAMDHTDRAAVSGGYGGWTTPMNDTAVRAILEQTLGGAPKANSLSAGVLALVLLAALAGFTALALLVQRSRIPSPVVDDADSAKGAAPDVLLTPREREILTLIENGLTTKQIARDLDISPKTVEFHRSRLMKKFDASTMAEVVHRAHGLKP